MEHSIHVSSGHFIRGVGPTSTRKILKKVKVASGSRQADSRDSDDEDLNEYHEDTRDSGDDGDEEHGVKFDAGDTVGKALVLVTQVRVLEHLYEHSCHWCRSDNN